MLGSVHDGDHDGVVRIFVGISYVGLTGLNTEHQFFFTAGSVKWQFQGTHSFLVYLKPGSTLHLERTTSKYVHTI